jgi:hypothetical protein
MSSYKSQLEKFLSNRESQPPWDRHIPDELCAHIVTLEDFVEFLRFVEANLNSDLLEYGCEDTEQFLARLPARLASKEFLVRTEERQIQSDLGRIAFAMILALGN